MNEEAQPVQPALTVPIDLRDLPLAVDFVRRITEMEGIEQQDAEDLVSASDSVLRFLMVQAADAAHSGDLQVSRRDGII